MTNSLHVPHEATGVRLARRAVRDQMDRAGQPAGLRDDAVLVVSELVSNSVRHAAALPTGDIVVSWGVDDDTLHLEITDGGATGLPRAGVAVLTALGGRGLDIVRTVSRHWGVIEGTGSVTVWADLVRGDHRRSA